VGERTFTLPQFTCRMEHPDDWHLWVGALQHLELPRQVFALSNRNITAPTAVPGSKPPVVERLDADAALLWVHYRLPGDSDAEIGDPSPNYPGVRVAGPGTPGRLSGPPIIPSTQLTWQARYGDGEVTVTATAWEGSSLSDSDARRLHDVIASLAVEFR